MSNDSGKAATEYCQNTTFVDETGDDEALVYNIQFMAFCAGWEAAKVHDSGQPSPWTPCAERIATEVMRELDNSATEVMRELDNSATEVMRELDNSIGLTKIEKIRESFRQRLREIVLLEQAREPLPAAPGKEGA